MREGGGGGGGGGGAAIVVAVSSCCIKSAQTHAATETVISPLTMKLAASLLSGRYYTLGT